VAGFDWDDANIQHIAEHDVGTDEVEYVITHDPLDVEIQVRESEERFVQVGATAAGRILLVISIERRDRVRVVTAFDAGRRHRLMYERWRGESYGTEA
jgi:uncharacterized DUF497 family protein